MNFIDNNSLILLALCVAPIAIPMVFMLFELIYKISPLYKPQHDTSFKQEGNIKEVEHKQESKFGIAS